MWLNIQRAHIRICNLLRHLISLIILKFLLVFSQLLFIFLKLLEIIKNRSSFLVRAKNIQHTEPFEIWYLLGVSTIGYTLIFIHFVLKMLECLVRNVFYIYPMDIKWCLQVFNLTPLHRSTWIINVRVQDSYPAKLTALIAAKE